MTHDLLIASRPAADAVRGVFAASGGALIEPPALQPLAPYIDVSGEDVRARLFVVDAPDGARLCLRPDMTIPVCLHHIGVHSGAPEPGFYRVDGHVFRYAKDPALGPAEFTQLGLERFGDDDPVASDIEMCALALEAVRAGGGHISHLMLGDAYLFPAFFRAMDLDADRADRLVRRTRRLGADQVGAGQVGDGQVGGDVSCTQPSALAQALAHMPPEQVTDVLSEMFAMSGVEAVGSRSVAAIGERLAEQARTLEDDVAFPEAAAHAQALMGIAGAPRQALDDIAALCRKAGVDLDDRLQQWALRVDALEALDLPADTSVSVAFARQFDYYDGMVFEVRDHRLGLAHVLAAGGRYDTLYERLGGSGPLSGVGVMARPLRIAQSSRLSSDFSSASPTGKGG